MQYNIDKTTSDCFLFVSQAKWSPAKTYLASATVQYFDMLV